MSDRQGQPKGFGFGEFGSISEASKALHLLQVCFEVCCKLLAEAKLKFLILNIATLACPSSDIYYLRKTFLIN